ncbi:MAG: hypothetical protein JXA78_06895 [Anaerolineales bacterium]|nr:hypothetical protein [Anaerolineales bacterium]
MKKKVVFAFSIVAVFVTLACNLLLGLGSAVDQEATEVSTEAVGIQPTGSEVQTPIEETEGAPEAEPTQPRPPQAPLPSGAVIPPENLVYLGAFRLPDDSGGSGWEYSGKALAYYPGGDPNGPQDGFPGSLFAAGYDQLVEVGEIGIPEPVISRNLEDLNIATTLQPLQDVSSGIYDPEAVTFPRVGLEYLPPQGGQTSGKLYFCFGQHIQDFELSHGWRELDLSHTQVAGLWQFGDYSNYTSNDYLFEIPKSWADVYTPGQYLASGRAREGPWSGNGPALFAYGPWNDGNPPQAGARLSSITPLLLYGVQEPGIPEIVTDETMAVNERSNSDHWLGGAWLTAGDRAAVIFVGTKAIGKAWYGFANGVEFIWGCEETDSCPEVPEWPYDDRGFWAEGYRAQIMFFDPAQLAAVAQGEIDSWAPQPYAFLDITDYMYAPNIDPAIYKRDLAGAVAFDREHGLLYVAEILADEYKTVIHVWQLE